MELTAEQKEYIRKYYPIKYPKYISDEINVPKETIREFAKQEGLKKIKKNTDIVDGRKVCGCCNEWVPLERFHRSENLKKHPCGYQDWCIDCYEKYKGENADKFDKYKERNTKKAKNKGIYVVAEEKNKTSLKEYICKECGTIKLGREFSFIECDFKRDTVCKACRNEKAKNNKIKRIKNEN